MEIKILGCGSSLGVPIVGCDCRVCCSDDSRNKRTRQAIYVENDAIRILVDFGPDIRSQMLANGISDVDAILFTHSHSDHIAGLDEVRALSIFNKKTIALYMDEETLKVVKEQFGYILRMKFHLDGKVVPAVKVHIIEAGKCYNIAGLDIYVFAQDHVDMKSLGFKFKNFAYSTDFLSIHKSELDKLKGIDTWVVECIGYDDGPGKRSHSRVSNSLRLIEYVSPKSAVFIHMSHEIDYEVMSEEVPNNVCLAYDGMSIRF